MGISTIQLIVAFSLGYVFGEAMYNYIKKDPHPRDGIFISLLFLWYMLQLLSFIRAIF